MRKLLIIAIVAVVAMGGGCKKDKAADPVVDVRDKYVGVWKGNQTIIVTDLDINDQSEGTNTISKSSANTNRLLITNGTDVMNANISGNTYVYEQWTVIDNSGGSTWTIIYNGSGTVSGNTLTESGTISISFDGETHTGTWSCSMTKQ